MSFANYTELLGHGRMVRFEKKYIEILFVRVPNRAHFKPKPIIANFIRNICTVLPAKESPSDSS